MQQATDFPEPTGPLIPLKKWSDFKKFFSVDPSGLYDNSGTTAYLYTL